MNFADDTTVQKQLFPFTLTRPIADIRIGITTIREKWELFSANAKFEAASHLIPTEKIVNALKAGHPVPGEGLYITDPWNIFQYNDRVLRIDFENITRNRQSA